MSIPDMISPTDCVGLVESACQRALRGATALRIALRQREGFDGAGRDIAYDGYVSWRRVDEGEYADDIGTHALTIRWGDGRWECPLFEGHYADEDFDDRVKGRDLIEIRGLGALATTQIQE